MSKKEIIDRRDGAWRAYDAICRLGVADVSQPHKEEVDAARKMVWERYKALSVKLEKRRRKQP